MAQHKPTPRRRYEIETESGKHRIRRTSTQYAHQIVRDEFPDAELPGEKIDDNQYRFYSPKWGGIVVTWEDA